LSSETVPYRFSFSVGCQPSEASKPIRGRRRSAYDHGFDPLQLLSFSFDTEMRRAVRRRAALSFWAYRALRYLRPVVLIISLLEVGAHAWSAPAN